MRLIIEGFTNGLVDEDTITRMGLAQLSEGLGEKEVRISNCPATDINAMDFYTRFALNKMQGRESLNTSPWVNSAIMRFYRWTTEAGLDHTMVFSCLSGAASAAIATVTTSGGETLFTSKPVSSDGLSGWAPEMTDMIDVCAYAGSAIMTYGADNLPLGAYDGGDYVLAVGGTNAPSGARTVAAWGSFLFTGNLLVNGVRQRSRITWNRPLQLEWSASDYMDLDAGDGDNITAMWVLKDILVVFKRYRTYIVKYVGGVLQFDWERIDNAVGCVGPNAISESDGILYFIGPDGFYSFDGYHPPVSISTNIERKVARINSEMDYASEVDEYEEKGQLFFLIPEGSSEYKNILYIYDLARENWTKWDVTASCLANVTYGSNTAFIDLPEAYETYSMAVGDALGAKDGFMALGTYDGYIQSFGESENDLGEAIDAYWVSPWIDCGYPDRNKRITRVTVFADSTDTYSYPVEFIVYKDWDDNTEAVSEEFTTGGEDIDIVEKRVDFTLPCRSFKIKLRVNTLNATVTIHKIVIEFLMKGKTLVT